MSTNLAKTTIFKVGTVAVTQITSLTWSGTSFKTEDTTSFDGTISETMVPTVYTNGKYSLVLDYDVNITEHATLRALSLSGALQSFIVVVAGGAETQTFNAYVTSFAFDSPVSGLLKAKIDVMITGAMTLS